MNVDEQHPFAEDRQIEKVVVFQLASSGGTFVSATLTRVSPALFLNEVHPYETNYGLFSPTDLVNLSSTQVSLSKESMARNFDHQFSLLTENLAGKKKSVLVRGHSHFDYMDPRGTPGELRRFFAERAFVAGFTVREPVDTFLSARRRGFVGDDLKDYLYKFRRFLDDHIDLPFARYEDFLSNSLRAARKFAKKLALPFRFKPIPLSQTPKISGTERQEMLGFFARPRTNLAQAREAVEAEQLVGVTSARADLKFIRDHFNYRG